MATFINRSDITPGYFNIETFYLKMKCAYELSKDEIKDCSLFIADLEKNHPDQIKELYAGVAKDWKKLSGNPTIEKNSNLGKRLCCNRLVDPFVRKSVLKRMPKSSIFPEIQIAISTNFKNRVEIKCVDSVGIPLTIHKAGCKPNKNLRKNFLRAYEILNYVSRHTPYSANNFGMHYEGVNLRGEYDVIEELVGNLQEKQYDRTSSTYLIYVKSRLSNSFEKWIKRGKICNKSIVGNCGESTAVGFLYGSTMNTKVDAFRIEGKGKDDSGDHAALIIGKKHKVICDIWKRCIFEWSEIPNLLYDFKGTTHSLEAIIEKFDPKKQIISLLASNVYSLEDFESESSSHIPKIEQMLKVFHSISARNKEQKKAQAIKIIEFIQKHLLSKIVSNEGLCSLFSQMRYLAGYPQLDIIDLPHFSDFKEAEKANDPKMFCRIAKEKLSSKLNVNNLAFWMSNRTGNILFVKEAMKLKVNHDERTFMLASLIAIKRKDIDYLNCAIEMGAEADDYAFQRFLQFTRKTGNFDFLRLAIAAGAKPNRDEMEFLVEEAIKTGNRDILNMFDPETDTGKKINRYHEELIKKRRKHNDSIS